MRKHALIRAFIAKRASGGKPKAPETSGIIHKRNSSVKTEDGQAPAESNPYIEDKMHTTIAAGLVADELPRDLVSRFLEAVEGADVFNGPSAVQAPAAITPVPDSPMKETTHFSPPREKKRPLEEPMPAVTPGPSKRGTITSFFKKQ